MPFSFEISTRRTGGGRYRPPRSLSYSPPILAAKSLSNSSIVSPSTPGAPCRFICFHLSSRNYGLSRCANDVKRIFGSVPALAAMRDNFVFTVVLPLRATGVFLSRPLLCNSTSPCTRLSRAPSTMQTSDSCAGVRLRQAKTIPPEYSMVWHSIETPAGLQGSSTILFPLVPCSQTPPESPAAITSRGCLPSAFQIFELVGLRSIVTRLNHFTCVTA